MTNLTPEQCAERCAEIMAKRDTASNMLGIRMLAIAPGTATMQMRVEAQHLNGNGVCHGGLIFTLADSAFAYACNTYNQVTVAQHNSITYITPAQPGEILTATAREVNRSGRSGIYDIKVTGTDGRVVAEFRGGSRTVKGTHFDETKDDQ